MPNKTANYGFIKPLATEYYDVNIQNGNMDMIDREIKSINETSNKKMSELDSKINDMKVSEFKTDVLKRFENFIIVDKIEPKNSQHNTFWLHDIGDVIPSIGDGVVIANASFNDDKGIKFEEIK